MPVGCRGEGEAGRAGESEAMIERRNRMFHSCEFSALSMVYIGRSSH
jgi:hypothetical protein